MKKPHGNKLFKQKELKELMNITDVGAYLGWHRAKVNTYRRRAEDGSLKRVDFPEPYVYVADRAHWTKDQIIKFAENNRERLGPNSGFVGDIMEVKPDD